MSSASEAAVAMASRDIFGLSPTASNNPAAVVNVDVSQPQMEQHMPMSYNPGDGFQQVGSLQPHYQPISAGASAIHHQVSMNSGEQKRKRGRPRRYGPNGSMSASTQQPHTFSPPPLLPAAPSQTEIVLTGSTSPIFKKARGRPRGSQNKKKKTDLKGSAGSGFLPQILNVNAGEDISSKLLAVSQNGPRVVCVLSASGSISHVTLRQAATSGGTVTYEGRFDILSLSGSFMRHELGSEGNRSGGLSVALCGPDGRVLGGSVAGLLVAASASQIIVGCFEPAENDTVVVAAATAGVVGPNSSPSRGSQSESSGGPVSPLNMGIDLSDAMPWK